MVMQIRWILVVSVLSACGSFWHRNGAHEGPLECTEGDRSWIRAPGDLPHKTGQQSVLGVSHWDVDDSEARRLAVREAKVRMAEALNTSIVSASMLRRDVSDRVESRFVSMLSMFASADIKLVKAQPIKQCVVERNEADVRSYRAYVVLLVDTEASLVKNKQAIADELETAVDQVAKALEPKLRTLAGMAMIPYAGSFWIDSTEVTNEKYQECVLARVCTAPQLKRSPAFADPQQPVVGVTFQEAVQYCKWRRKRLPTPEEWILAAYGDNNNPYPWGADPPDCKLAHYARGERFGCGSGHSARVGRYLHGATREGVLDMEGNVAEFTNPVLNQMEAAGVVIAGTTWKDPKVGRRLCDLLVMRTRETTDSGLRCLSDWSRAPETWKKLMPIGMRAFDTVGFRCAATTHPAD